mgnify:CR=1 FL=1|jgi:hypothetical protein
MKVGDLIVANGSSHCRQEDDCFCFFCTHESSRIGVVIERLNEANVNHSAGYWEIMFDVGEWRLYGSEAEVISESR